MKRTWAIGVLALASVVPAVRGEFINVTGQVVDRAGKPVAGAEIASDWNVDEQGRLKASASGMSGTTRSDASGRFTLECERNYIDFAVMAVDEIGQRGGIVASTINSRKRFLKIVVEPLVEIRGHFTCEESGKPPDWTNVMMFWMPGAPAHASETWKARVGSCQSGEAKFALKLPPGRYSFWGYARISDYVRVEKEVTLEPGKVLDLGAIDLKLTPIARHYGKPPPALHVTAARGVKKDVRIDDFRGKWLVLDFWHYSRGPCVYYSLPDWIDFCEEQAANRERFEVLAIHDTKVESFAVLDEKLKPIIETQWRGRTLPFPILLDATGETVENFGVHAFPTVLVVDPEGKLVKLPPDQSPEEYLASKLPPLPGGRPLAVALDRGLDIGYSDDTTLGKQIEYLAKAGRIKIEVDDEALKARGVGKDTPLALPVNGRLSLRSCLNLTLEPYGLTYVAAGDGLRVVSRTAGNGDLARPSDRQIAENARLVKTFEKLVSFNFQAYPLKHLVKFLEDKTGETFVLDRSAPKAGTVSPAAVVSGKSLAQPLSVGLPKLLKPLGMTYVVRDEVIVLTKGL